MVATTDFEEEMPPTIQLGEKSEEELMGLIQRRWQLRLRSIIFLRAEVDFEKFTKFDSVENPSRAGHVEANKEEVTNKTTIYLSFYMYMFAYRWSELRGKRRMEVRY
ncbi:hypothetical protein KY290_029754 [Solanum tuberosum]|uniref:Uncharacterized protein n=1 Tax=Solanum tuberosum TaxID=4113 RepID=A0ABQ7ULN1_SOLTU|nr:hypothetical protein KY289_028975 [Solanum tuberosum]KAH0663879.1 hypothetical protein KY284_028810 [Solanum tuberosum]KAH0667584.1 hypothetical protein KY285_028790 [Solanum tuberosum]KAH0750522.1 hypothetical protein KY290_029754 [Solanum tuberosum]